MGSVSPPSLTSGSSTNTYPETLPPLPARLCSVYVSHLSMQLIHSQAETGRLIHSGEGTDEEGPKSPASPTVASCQNKSRKRESSRRTDGQTWWEGEDSGWVKCQSKLLQGVLTPSRTYTHTQRLFLDLPLIHTLCVSLSQHSAPPNHYLLVKPMPELGEETKRHREDYF